MNKEAMISINPKEVSVGTLHKMLLGAVAPRPIAFASTINTAGRPNLAPFSFFNVFSANPPMLIFSPARRVRNNTVKHTLENVMATKEVVINVVNYAMVQQTSLASTEYPEGVNEFVKSGLIMLDSKKVAPFRVAEAPVQFECKVKEVIPMGNEGGAGNLVLCEVVLIHVKEAVLDTDGGIDQHKIDLVSRMGRNWYSRSNMGMFEVPKPLSTIGMGIDALPEAVRKSTIFTGNDLGKLGNITHLPSYEEARLFIVNNLSIKNALEGKSFPEIHKFVQQYLDRDDIDTAWKIIVAKLAK